MTLTKFDLLDQNLFKAKLASNLSAKLFDKSTGLVLKLENFLSRSSSKSFKDLNFKSSISRGLWTWVQTICASLLV